MTMHTEAIFEAPAAHEGAHEAHEAHEDYSVPEATEWEDEAAYSSPEWEWEAHEQHESHYTNPYSVPEAAEWEDEDYSLPEAEFEYEDEFENEADAFFKKAMRAVRSVARRIAPMAVRALGGMIPGVGAIAGPMLGQLTQALVREGELEAATMEAQLFGQNESVAEVAHTEAGHEAALTEVLAAEAAEAATEAEAESMLAASLPITITIMRARRAVRPVMPTLTQANARLVSTLRRQGPAGRQLLRAVPTIQRRAVGTLRAAARRGRPVTGPLAVRAMAAATRNVLSNPRLVQRAVARNSMLRQRTAPPSPRRAAVFTPSRTAPLNARRAAGLRPMRAAGRRPPF